MKRWCKRQNFLVAFYFPAIYRQFLDLQQYGWTTMSFHDCYINCIPNKAASPVHVVTMT